MEASDYAAKNTKSFRDIQKHTKQSRLVAQTTVTKNKQELDNCKKEVYELYS